MASYELRIRRSAEKEIRKLPDGPRRRVVAGIQGLASEPRPPGCERLTARDAWRIRIGTYRVIYTVDDQAVVVEVVRVGHRRDVYR
jgi:mRNA interferase RelE/StbE